MSAKYVYLFSEGNGKMRELLGGKGANLAEMTGLPQSKISDHERGRYPMRNTTLETACKLALALGVHAEDLLEDDARESIERTMPTTSSTSGTVPPSPASEGGMHAADGRTE